MYMRIEVVMEIGKTCICCIFHSVGYLVMILCMTVQQFLHVHHWVETYCILLSHVWVPIALIIAKWCKKIYQSETFQCVFCLWLFWQILQLFKRAYPVHLQINKTADLAHTHYWPLLSSLALNFCFLCFLLQMYETRLLPHETDQITVSILLKNQSSSVIKELVFSMCDTSAVSLLRAVCNEFDIIMYTVVWHHVFQVNHKLHRLRAPFMPFMLHLSQVCSLEIVTCKFVQFAVIRIYGTQYARELICLVTYGISWPLGAQILT